jgi:perosamine synthetase
MIFQNVPLLDGNERKYVMDCLDTNWISSQGKYIAEFEKFLADYCNVAYAVACSSGTAALHIALEALGVGPGDEVIVPCFTLVADSNMAILAGAKPVFVDVDPATWCIDVDLIENKITEKTVAIICVHMYGHPCDMDKIINIAKRHNLFVIEDAAQAHGTEYKGRKAGSLSDVACFSFYATKTLTTGEGGMIVTDNIDVAERAKIIRNQGFEGSRRTYLHRLLGFNYRLTNIQAAIGLAQCERIEEKIEKKRKIYRRYNSLLASESEMILQVEKSWAKSTYWNTVVLIKDDFGKSRDEVIKELEENGIQTQLVFKALNQQPVYAESQDPRYPDISGSYPVSEDLSGRGLCLPSSLALTDGQIEEVAEKLLQCHR